jgi:shikimate 5-dehydrogenase
VIDGIEVLARQAAHSFKLWTGVDPGYRLMESIAWRTQSFGCLGLSSLWSP